MSTVHKVILDRYKNIILCFNLMHINRIVFLSNIYLHIIVGMGIMIKTIRWRALRVDSTGSKKCTYDVGSISPAYMMIVNLNH